MRQEQSDIGVACVESQQRHSALRLLVRRQPLRQQRGLARPSRCRNEDQPRAFSSVRAQLIGEAGALHQLPTQRRQMQLGAQHRHSVSVGPPFARATASVTVPTATVAPPTVYIYRPRR